ncbi:MAG: exodeoxyribonuclease VII small subunit [Bdellovibrionota bacterium]|nr:exodeoxyribonuclease VII small subunit [Pseudomonadota bacterium]MDY6089669.1 exodeoxyribonuclease VII small subunit [Bdellovibrionota bacterium]
MKIKIKDLLADNFDEKLLDDIKFEEGTEILEALINQIEDGSLSLDTSIVAYERGNKILSMLSSMLDGAEKKLEVISNK